jgi:hypothetical protein
VRGRRGEGMASRAALSKFLLNGISTTEFGGGEEGPGDESGESTFFAWSSPRNKRGESFNAVHK